MSPAPSREAVIDRLPRTMAASMTEQLARRDRLFPVEQRLLDGRLEWLAQLGRVEFDRLFAAVHSLESRMDLPPLGKGEARLSIENTAIIARSLLYPEWRRETERAFATMDDGAEKLHPAGTVPRLLILVLPAGLPADPDPWRDGVPGGVRVKFQQEFGEIQADLLSAVAGRDCSKDLAPIERTWVVACDARPYAGLSHATVVSWDDIAGLRREFLDRLNAVSRTLHSVDETMSTLARMDLGALLPPRLTGDPRLREFIRALLLSGNGSLVMNNSFVQWCSSEALRRAQPQVLVAAFGIRDRPKPFSSLVWFEDQARANPAPDQQDSAGSLVDDAMLSRYVYLTAHRLSAYAGRTLAWFVVADRKSAMVVTTGANTPKLPASDQLLSSAQIREACLNWLTVK